MTCRRISLLLGLLSLVICLGTWALDWANLVDDCIYCRNERTIIGLLGILLLLPKYPYITRYLSFVLGFYGANVSSQHIMLVMKHANFYSIMFPLTIAALFIITGQLFFIFYWTKESP